MLTAELSVANEHLNVILANMQNSDETYVNSYKYACLQTVTSDTSKSMK